MLGELSRSGVGEPTEVDCVKSVHGLKASCGSSNAILLKELRENDVSHALLKLTLDDAALGRMAQPVPVKEMDLQQVLCNPRFGVCQEKDDGSCKMRAIDHLSWSPASADVV